MNVPLALPLALPSRWLCNFKTEIPYWLAELVLKTNKSEHYLSCLEHLVELHSLSPFPLLEFRFHGYSALLLFGLGESEKARTEAIKAIDWASRDRNLLQNERKRKLVF
jgi:hypothetical protein